MSSFSRSSVRFSLLSSVSLALAIAIFSGTGLAQVPLRQYDTTLKQMFNAIQSKSYEPTIKSFLPADLPAN